MKNVIQCKKYAAPVESKCLFKMSLFTLSSVYFDLNFYTLRNLHSIVSLVLILCCVFCISIRHLPFVQYHPLFNLLCNLCIFSVNFVIVVLSTYVLFEVLSFVTDAGVVTTMC